MEVLGVFFYSYVHMSMSTAGCARIKAKDMVLGCSYIYNVYLSRTDSLTQLAGDASLLSIGVATECVFSPEPRTQRTFLEWIHQCHRLSEECRQCHSKTWSVGESEQERREGEGGMMEGKQKG